MRKILVALDGSENSLKAVHYAGTQFGCSDDIRIVLCNVLPIVPAEFWDDGHILTEKERTDRKNVIDKWIENQKLQLDPMFAAAKNTLSAAGVEADQVTTKLLSDSLDIAASICEEARTGGYQTLVIGRCGRSDPQGRIGMIAEKIARLGAVIPVCIV